MQEIDSKPPKERAKVDVEVVVSHLFSSFPDAKYIALNPGLKTSNAETWEDSWYFIGFDEPPVYKNLDGAPAWVANESIMFSEEEWGLFYLHLSSNGLEFRGEPIQKSRYDFASPRLFCWELQDDGTIQQLYADELDEPDDSKETVEAFKTFLQDGIYKPLQDFLSKDMPK